MDPSNFGSFGSGGVDATNISSGGVTPGTNPTVSSGQVNPVQNQGFVGAQTQMAQTQVQQPMQFQPQMVSSDMGDVTLDSVKSRKPRKGLVILAVLILIVLFGILAVFAVRTMTSKSEENSKRNFNIFANYVLYGKSEDAQNLEINATGQYAVEEVAFHNADIAKEFYSLAMKYWKSFDNVYSAQNEETTDKMKEISDELAFLDQFANSGLMSGDKILEIYYYGGEDAVVDEYAKYYSGFRKDSEVFRGFMMIQDIYINSAIQLLKLYNQEGCIVDAKENIECIEEKQLVNSEYYIDVASVNRKTAQYISSIEADLANDVIELNSLIVKESGYES